MRGHTRTTGWGTESCTGAAWVYRSAPGDPAQSERQRKEEKRFRRAIRSPLPVSRDEVSPPHSAPVSTASAHVPGPCAIRVDPVVRGGRPAFTGRLRAGHRRLLGTALPVQHTGGRLSSGPSSVSFRSSNARGHGRESHSSATLTAAERTNVGEEGLEIGVGEEFRRVGRHPFLGTFAKSADSTPVGRPQLE